ncbi:Uncharacterised protein [Vibrio cholerae]|uniref:Uncharacterized protein n=1 Tax=Vibrio cholerae TaxID=666 RepID=A0A655XY67_VIBCL|nr:Uncharacterised protein [Vibrio cholerae]CSC25648.1 Uncharacterised protein [Vibrio cholerae]CSC41647.1 Uncharacterised protein [Vibrio cholerae]CSC41679.1 Uncharacterised protein [Vibrio cholerae]
MAQYQELGLMAQMPTVRFPKRSCQVLCSRSSYRLSSPAHPTIPWWHLSRCNPVCSVVLVSTPVHKDPIWGDYPR